MASLKKTTDSSYQSATGTAKQQVDAFSGVGKQFKVKFVGCDNVTRKRGDAEAAKYAIMSLKNAVKQMKTHKPRAVLGLTVKGMSLFDEQSKNTTRVPLQKVIYVAHDCEDICFFGVIVASKDSHTGYKLYCFKAEQKIAVSFVRSSQELFSLMYKLKKAKKQIKEQREGTSTSEETDNKDDSVSSLPADNAPPPSYGTVTEQPWPSDDPKPPEVNEERRQKAIDDWNKLESELTDIAKDLNLGDDQKPRPGVNSEGEAEHLYAQVKKKNPPPLSSAGAADMSDFDAIFGGGTSQSFSTPNQPSSESEVKFSLNPFQESDLSSTQQTTSFDSNFSGQLANPLYSSSASPGMTLPSQPQVEPSIAFDLAEIFQTPAGGLQSTTPSSFGNPFAQPIPLGDPMSSLMGGPEGSPISGPIGGPGGGPMGGPIGGPMRGPIGGPMGGPIGGPMSAPAGAPMGTVFSAQPQGLTSSNPFVAFQNTGAAPQQSGDIFSSTNDAFMQSSYVQPLLPEPEVKIGPRKLGADPPPKPKPHDAFADLVSIAKSTPEKKASPHPSSPPVPQPSMMDMMRQKEQSENKISQEMLFAFSEATDSGPDQPHTSQFPLQQTSTSATGPSPQPASSQGNWVEFDSNFGDQFTTPTQPPPTTTVPQAANGSSWVSF